MENYLENILEVVDTLKGHDEVSEIIDLKYKILVCKTNYDVSEKNFSECYCICSDCDCTGDFCDNC